MPERDGYEVASFIKSTPQFSHIPVLLLTGAFEPVDEARAQSVGCDGVLVKPFEPQMVISRVKDLLAGRRPGLWGGGPPPPTPFRQPAADGAGSAPADAASAAPSASLEDYFDRLDAAFGSLETSGAERHQAPDAAAAPSPGPSRIAEFPVPVRDGAAAAADLGEALAAWDPDLSADPGRSAARAETPAPSLKPVAAPVLHAVPPAAAGPPAPAAPD